MIVVLVLIVLLIALVVGIWLFVNIVGLIFTLIIAGLIGWLADRIVPGELPYGWLGAIVAGLLGSFVGGILLGDLGPEIFDISVIPALAGAVILAFVANLVVKRQASA